MILKSAKKTPYQFFSMWYFLVVLCMPRSVPSWLHVKDSAPHPFHVFKAWHLQWLIWNDRAPPARRVARWANPIHTTHFLAPASQTCPLLLNYYFSVSYEL